MKMYFWKNPLKIVPIKGIKQSFVVYKTQLSMGNIIKFGRAHRLCICNFALINRFYSPLCRRMYIMHLTMGYHNKNKDNQRYKNTAYDMVLKNGTRIKENKTNERTKSCASYAGVIFLCCMNQSRLINKTFLYKQHF